MCVLITFYDRKAPRSKRKPNRIRGGNRRSGPSSCHARIVNPIPPAAARLVSSAPLPPSDPTPLALAFASSPRRAPRRPSRRSGRRRRRPIRWTWRRGPRSPRSTSPPDRSPTTPATRRLFQLHSRHLPLPLRPPPRFQPRRPKLLLLRRPPPPRWCRRRRRRTAPSTGRRSPCASSLFPFLQSFGCASDFLFWFVACGWFLLLTFLFFLSPCWVDQEEGGGWGRVQDVQLQEVQVSQAVSFLFHSALAVLLIH